MLCWCSAGSSFLLKMPSLMNHSTPCVCVWCWSPVPFSEPPPISARVPEPVAAAFSTDAAAPSQRPTHRPAAAASGEASSCERPCVARYGVRVARGRAVALHCLRRPTAGGESEAMRAFCDV